MQSFKLIAIKGKNNSSNSEERHILMKGKESHSESESYYLIKIYMKSTSKTI